MQMVADSKKNTRVCKFEHIAEDADEVTCLHTSVWAIVPDTITLTFIIPRPLHPNALFWRGTRVGSMVAQAHDTQGAYAMAWIPRLSVHTNACSILTPAFTTGRYHHEY